MNEIAILNLGHFNASEHQPFYANTLAQHLQTSHQHIEKPHKHDFYAAILFTKGSGVHHIDFKAFEVQRGSLFFLAPGQTHSWVLSDDADGYIFFHTKEFYNLHFITGMSEFPFFSPLRNHCAMVLGSSVQLQETESRFARILEEHQSARIKRNDFILSIINQLYISFERASADNTAPDIDRQHTYYVKFREFETLVGQHFKSEKSAEKYAGMMHITAKHLNRINKAITGKTTTDIIVDRVLLEAKRMLIYSESNLNEIAFMLGYDDYAYFSRVFRKRVGVSPRGFSKGELQSSKVAK
jgi:AraC family transcriptional regulator, transcriptional activator of pobA